MAGRVSLKDIAADTGVSVSTVSLALTGDRRVTEATRERVRAAAAKLGYVRDPLLASLAAGRFRHAGKPARIAISANGPWMARLKQQAEAMGMTTCPFETPTEGIQEAAIAQGCAALILNRRGIDISNLAQSTLPTFLWEDEGPANPPVDLIETCEWWTATSGAIERVRAAGYTRPVAVLIPAKPRHWHDDIRLACAKAMGVPVYEWSGDDAADVAAAAFLAKHQADAIIAGMPHIHERLQRQGVQLPLAVLLVHAGPWFAQFTGWQPDQDHRGQVTLELIEQRLRYGPRAPRRIVIPPQWQDGKTLPLKS
jgi:DNA-binding LacI/PurR family transcriptional regulator